MTLKVMLCASGNSERCGQVCGASWLYRLRTITVPLLRPGLLAAWLLIFVASVRELGALDLRKSEAQHRVVDRGQEDRQHQDSECHPLSRSCSTCHIASIAARVIDRHSILLI